MKKRLLLAFVFSIASPAYGQVDIGTSASSTNPQVTGDATTGLFSSASGAVSTSSGGTEIMRVNGTGVGIGTTSPLVSLDIPTANTSDSILRTGTMEFSSYALNNSFFGDNVYYNGSTFTRRQTGTAGLFYFYGNNGTNMEGQFRLYASGSGSTGINSGIAQLKVNADGSFAVGPSVTTTPGSYTGATFLVNNSGNVGIGTTSPAQLLNVYGGTSYGQIGINASGTNNEADIGFKSSNVSSGAAGNWLVGVNIGNSSGDFSIWNAGTNDLYIKQSNGNVGIGTTSPAYALDIRGTAGSTVASNGLPVINKINVKTFTSSGTYTPSTGMVYALIEVIGAGGGGAGAPAATGASSSGGGGAGGAYARGIKTTTTIGSSQTVTVGSGGAGGAAGLNNGSNGGSSSVGSLISAGGGSYGTSYSATTSTGFNGGSNGAGTPGGTYDYGVPGQDGWAGISFGGNSCISGFGGSSGLGSPGGYQVVKNNAGAAASGYGGGGSGGCTMNTTTAQPGGAGAPGLVVITEYISD